MASPSEPVQTPFFASFFLMLKLLLPPRFIFAASQPCLDLTVIGARYVVSGAADEVSHDDVLAMPLACGDGGQLNAALRA